MKKLRIMASVLAGGVLLFPAGPSRGEEVIIEPFRKLLAEEVSTATCPSPHPGVMRPDAATRREWQESMLAGPRAYLDPQMMPKRGSRSLISHFSYTPSLWDQGNCGNCWAWAGTACLAIALDVQEGIRDSLSVQLANSCYTGSDYTCCGGWAYELADWYNSLGYCIPWSNTNGNFQDGGRDCSDGSSLVACGSVGKTPSYPVSSCSAPWIPTQGVTQATAIANIKNVLNQNKAVWFAFYAPNTAASNKFSNFWDNDAENEYLPNFLDAESCGQSWDANGWGHAVLCYGYNDDDPNNPVWYMLNSWGGPANRPHGFFLVDMDINYGCQSYDNEKWEYNYWWATFDVNFGSPAASDRAPLQLYAGDFNGDAYSDLAIFRGSSGLWSIRGITRAYFGKAGDIPVPADFNGDGTSDIAVFRPSSGLWTARGRTRFYFGASGDTPIAMHNSGNGITAAIFRGSSGLWATRGGNRVYFGRSGDIPLPGPFVSRSGSRGSVNYALFRPSTGLWAVRGSTRYYFGRSGDTPVPGDYQSSYEVSTRPWRAAIFRSSSGLWSVRGITRAYFGRSGDIAVPADYAGGWGDEMAVFRSGLWAIRNGNRYYYGRSGDTPATR